MTKSAILKEIREVLGITLFFYIVFLIFQLYKLVTLAEFNIHNSILGVALIASLVIAKVIFLIDKMPLTKRMDSGPKIFGVVYRSVIYSIGFILFTFVEHAIREMISGEPFGHALEHGWYYLQSFEFFGTFLMTFVTFLVFNTYWVIRNHVGAGKLYRLFFKH